MLKSNLCNYSDGYILASRTIAVPNTGTQAAPIIEKKIKNCAPFNNCTSEVKNTNIRNAEDFDVVMPICNLTEYSDNYSNPSGSFMATQ